MTAGPRSAQGLTILFIHQAADLYGSDRMLLEAVTCLMHAGGVPIVLLPGPGPLLAVLEARGIEVHSLPAAQLGKLHRGALNARGLWRLASGFARSASAIDRCVAGRKIDGVCSNTLAVLGGAWWARQRRLPHLWCVHEIIEHPRWVARLLSGLVRTLPGRVVCNSATTARWLLRLQPQLQARLEVVANGVALPSEATHSQAEQAGSGASLRSAFRPSGATLAIGLVGRINRMKGHDLLLRAAELLHECNQRNFSLVFVGDAPPGQAHFEAQLRERVRRSPLAPRVHFAGFMPVTSFAYAALDIVCMPSQEAESFGLVAVEAMAAGRAVVASRVGALPEVLDQGRFGRLHAPGDPQALADALQALIIDPALREQLAQAGRQHVQQRYALSALNEGLLRQWKLAFGPTSAIASMEGGAKGGAGADAKSDAAAGAKVQAT